MAKDKSGPRYFKDEATNPELNISFDASATEKLLELMDRAQPLIVKTHNLYNMYRTGALEVPPNESRKQLDTLLETISLMAKPTEALRFRYNSLHSRYVTHRDRWDKLVKGVESGLIKRNCDKKKTSYRL